MAVFCIEPGYGVGNLLHGKGVGCGARPEPQYAYAGLESFGGVGFVGDLRGSLQTEFLFGLAQPCQGHAASSLEAAGHGARLPHAGTQIAHACGGKLPGGVKKLLARFGAARACYY